MYQTAAKQQWESASRKALWNRLFNTLAGEQQTTLLDFNAVSQRLHLRTAIYRGVQIIPLDRIVGSVGRYQDFTGAFLPTTADMRARWEHIATLYLNPAGPGVPPIEVYQVGESYFVQDGNHRVSVANQMDMKTIEAYVWEYPEPVAGLDSGADIDTLLLEAERQDFLDQTHLDDLRPQHGIRMTAPGGYLEILGQIAVYQEVLSKIDEQPIAYDYACTAWYDMLYETVVQIIESADVMELFPERTVADFYVWTMRYQQELQARYGERPRIEDIARKISREHRPALWQRLRHGMFGWLRRRLTT